MRKLFAIAALCLSAFGQQEPGVAISGGPPQRAYSTLYFYVDIGGTDYLQYTCYAISTQPTLTNQGAVGSQYTVTSIVDSSNTSTVTTSAAHGLSVGNRVVIAGVTGDLDLNGTYVIQSVGSTTTFTITTANVTDATYNNSNITITSSAPRTNQPIWAIKKLYYGGTAGTNLVAAKWAVSSSQQISSTAMQNVCDDRATLAYQ